MQLPQLKVKIKSLAEEARIIIKEEQKALKQARYQRRLDHKDFYPTGQKLYDSLYQHRKVDVGQEARSSILAYCFLRGKAYRQIEAKTKPGNGPNWRRVESIAKKFGNSDFKAEAFQEWIKQ
jgi:DNA invertase Pin-like site-specific DNA recombinase